MHCLPRRRWFRRNPHGADAIAAVTKAANPARKCTVQHLLTARLEQLREQAAAPTETVAAAAWMDQLPDLAARLLGCDAAGAVIAGAPN